MDKIKFDIQRVKNEAITSAYADLLLKEEATDKIVQYRTSIEQGLLEMISEGSFLINLVTALEAKGYPVPQKDRIYLYQRLLSVVASKKSHVHDKIEDLKDNIEDFVQTR
jgi:hypothetical protein